MIPILRKDLRRLWPHAALFWLLLALSAWLDPAYSGRMFAEEFRPLTVILVLACGSLIVNVIQQDAIPGDSHYWLTRPIPRGTLLASKGMFIALCVMLPVVLAQLIVYLALGLPLGEHAAALLAREAFFAAFLVLPVAALAAVTRNIGQSILILVLLAVAIFAIGASEIVKFAVPVEMSFSTLSALAAALLTAGAAAVLGIQYARRDTFRSAAAAAASALLITLVVHSRPPARPTPAEVLLQLMPPDQTGPSAPLLSFEFPVRFDGVPAGLDITVEDFSLGIGEANGPRPSLLRPFDATIRREADGRARLTVLRGQEALYNHLAAADLHFHAEMTLVLSRPGLTLPGPGKQGIVVPGFGRCVEGSVSSGLAVACYSPWPRTSLALESKRIANPP